LPCFFNFGELWYFSILNYRGNIRNLILVVESAAATQEVMATIEQITKAIMDAYNPVQKISVRRGKFEWRRISM